MLSPLTVLFAATHVAAWGANLHNVVGLVAQEFLSDSSKAQLAKILPQYNGELRNATTWADEIKVGAANKAQWGWASILHYVDPLDNPSKNCSYVDSRDCPKGDCVVGAIGNYTTRAVCDASGKAGPDQETAIKFLTHFLGDISQPLHVCGRLIGGNGAPVKFDNQTKIGGFPVQLHGMWDFTIQEKYYNVTAALVAATDKNALFSAGLIQSIKTGPYSALAKSWIPKSDFAALTTYGNSVSAIEMAVDSDGFNCQLVWNAYDDDATQDFGGKYYEAAVPVIKLQVAKAGYRLAYHLNKVLDTCAVKAAVTSAGAASASAAPFASAAPGYTAPAYSAYAATTAKPAQTGAVYSSAQKVGAAALFVAVLAL